MVLFKDDDEEKHIKIGGSINQTSGAKLLEQYVKGANPFPSSEVPITKTATPPSIAPTSDTNQNPRKKRHNPNVPKNAEERADFDQGFSTKPMIARTPLSQSMTSVKGEFKKIAEMAAMGTR